MHILGTQKQNKTKKGPTRPQTQIIIDRYIRKRRFTFSIREPVPTTYLTFHAHDGPVVTGIRHERRRKRHLWHMYVPRGSDLRCEVPVQNPRIPTADPMCPICTDSLVHSGSNDPSLFRSYSKRKGERKRCCC